MGASTVKTLVVPSRRQQIVAAQKTILKQIEQHNYGEQARFAIRLALDEAACNALRHGNHEDPDKHITFQYEITDQRVSISVTDEGDGFDPGVLPDPTHEANLDRPCGRGVMLMLSYMTEVSFSNGGRTITLIKDRNCRKPEA